MPVVASSPALARLRYQSHSGRFIRLHRALRRARITRATLLSAVALPVAFSAILLMCMPSIIGYWNHTLRFLLPRLGLDPSVLEYPLAFGAWSPGVLLVPALQGNPPDLLLTCILASGVALVMVLSYLGRDRHLPVAYLLWAMALLLALTIIVQSVSESFPHTISSHIHSELQLAVAFLLAVPWLLGVSYYVLDVGVLRKAGATVLIAGYIAAYVPFQYAAHLVVLHYGSLAFAPLLFVFAGMFVHVFIFIALYAWFMSWDRAE